MKAFNRIPGTHGIQPMVTIINYMPTLLFESLPCSTEGFVAEQQIVAKVREENHRRIQGLATLLYYTFFFSVTLIFGVPGCVVGFWGLLLAQMSLVGRALGGKSVFC